MKIKRVRKIVKPAPWDFRITLAREEAEGLRASLKIDQLALYKALVSVLEKAN